MPSKRTIGPLWKVVQQDLGLNVDPTLEGDQRRILGGLASIVDGVGAYRTHIGSAHGRGVDLRKSFRQRLVWPFMHLTPLSFS
jgi:Abortive infection C-terminus